MKKELLFVSSLLLVTSSLLAQGPTIDASNMNPYPGFVNVKQEARVIGTSNGSSGPSQIWDYSTLQDTATAPVTTEYVVADATPYLQYFNNANLCFRYGGTFIEYQETTDSDFYNLGQADSGMWHFDLSDPIEIWHYPLYYNRSYASTFSGTFTNGYTDNESGTDTIIADGYGSLKMPGGTQTFNNVLRVNTIDYYTDVYSGSESGTFLTIINSFYYLTPNYQNPLLSIIHEVQYYNGSLYSYGSSVSYATNASTGINDVNSLVDNINIFPNPSLSQATLSLNLKEAANITVYVTNILGQKIKTVTSAQVDAGPHNYDMETADMAKGIYLVTVEVNGSMISVNKLVVE